MKCLISMSWERERSYLIRSEVYDDVCPYEMISQIISNWKEISIYHWIMTDHKRTNVISWRFTSLITLQVIIGKKGMSAWSCLNAIRIRTHIWVFRITSFPWTWWSFPWSRNRSSYFFFLRNFFVVKELSRSSNWRFRDHILHANLTFYSWRYSISLHSYHYSIPDNRDLVWFSNEYIVFYVNEMSMKIKISIEDQSE